MGHELTRMFKDMGVGDGNAQELADVVVRGIQDHGKEDINPVDVTEYIGDFGDMDEVDDAVGMAEALGHLATALINVKDALVG